MVPKARKGVAKDRRISIDKDMRHGRKSRSQI